MVRQLCLALPEATERVSHGSPSWFIRKAPQFAAFHDGHHDDRIALIAAAPPGAQQEWVQSNSVRFFVPAYVGGRGWIGVYLDLPEDPDWEEVADILEESYRTVAPAKMIALLDAMDPE